MACYADSFTFFFYIQPHGLILLSILWGLIEKFTLDKIYRFIRACPGLGQVITTAL
jgi:hypothetical protein